MSIEITARHMHATEAMQVYARHKARDLMKEFPRTEHVHIILDVQRRCYVAEFVVQAGNHVRVEAAETSGDMRTSIDVALGKVEKQMRKIVDKVQNHKVVMKHAEAQRKREPSLET